MSTNHYSSAPPPPPLPPQLDGTTSFPSSTVPPQHLQLHSTSEASCHLSSFTKGEQAIYLTFEGSQTPQLSSEKLFDSQAVSWSLTLCFFCSPDNTFSSVRMNLDTAYPEFLQAIIECSERFFHAYAKLDYSCSCSTTPWSPASSSLTNQRPRYIMFLKPVPGNPPYVRVHMLSEHDLAEYREIFSALQPQYRVQLGSLILAYDTSA